jgi:HK97 family phage major capsid protein
MDPNELKRLHQETITQRQAILDTVAKREDKSLTEEERTKFDELNSKGSKIQGDIARIEQMRTEETARMQGGQKEKTDLKEFGDFVQAVRFDPRNTGLEVRADAGQTMGEGAEGGFVIPPRFIPAIKQLAIAEAIIRPRATVIPAGSPPDQTITFPALDQSTAYGMYSGVEVAWIGEGEEKPETHGHFREISLTPNEVAATMYITDKLLRNAPAVGAIIQKLMGAAIVGAEEVAFRSGNGVGRPLGVQNCAATIDVTRTGAGTIVYTDLINMLVKSSQSGSPTWIASRTILASLCTMVDGNNNLIWQPNAVAGQPSTLLGIPLLFENRAPVLGSAGDLVLVDLAYYLIKDGSGPSLSMSEHVRFTQNQTCVKIFWNVDGKCWLNTPILLEDGVTQVSPFVSLAA